MIGVVAQRALQQRLDLSGLFGLSERGAPEGLGGAGPRYPGRAQAGVPGQHLGILAGREQVGEGAAQAGEEVDGLDHGWFLRSDAGTRGCPRCAARGFAWRGC